MKAIRIGLAIALLASTSTTFGFTAIDLYNFNRKVKKIQTYEDIQKQFPKAVLRAEKNPKTTAFEAITRRDLSKPSKDQILATCRDMLVSIYLTSKKKHEPKEKIQNKIKEFTKSPNMLLVAARSKKMFKNSLVTAVQETQAALLRLLKLNES